MTVDVAVFDFTSGELAGALVTAKERGVVVRLVAEARQAQGKHSEVPSLLARRVKVRLTTSRGCGLMHHEFAIFDRKPSSPVPTTASAERGNRENAQFVNDIMVIRR